MPDEETRLARPVYVDLDRFGRIEAVYCKVCAMELARQDVNQELVRNRSYVEAKLELADGGTHVTNLCGGCLMEYGGLRGVLQQLYDADMEMLAKDAPVLERAKGKQVLRVREVDFDRKGLR